jgi:hydrocephalus-inducing protein
MFGFNFSLFLKILRMMKGYDVQNVLLLPPRAPGESLPPEIIDYYNEHNCEEEDGRSALQWNHTLILQPDCSIISYQDG